LNAAYSHLYHYIIPFREPVYVKGRRLLQREGLVLALKSSDMAVTAYGEIAPLPGLHQEPLQAAEQQTVEMLTRYRADLAKALAGPLLPSVRTGLEMAMLSYEAIENGTMPSLATQESAAVVPVNALLPAGHDAAVTRTVSLYRQGYRAFKLKVNPAAASAVATIVRTLYDIHGDDIELRIDANQSMSFSEACAFCSSLPGGSLRYIEEPLTKPAEIEKFHARTGVASALDETLWQDPMLAARIPDHCLGAYILKPSRLGGIRRTMELASEASQRHLRSVFSSSYESGISLGFYAWMAACTSSKPAACGLDTLRFLKHDLLVQSSWPDDSMLDPRQLFLNGQEVALRRIKLTSIWTL
jgi:O-succinylbenzoate synthase